MVSSKSPAPRSMVKKLPDNWGAALARMVDTLLRVMSPSMRIARTTNKGRRTTQISFSDPAKLTLPRARLHRREVPVLVRKRRQQGHPSTAVSGVHDQVLWRHRFRSVTEFEGGVRFQVACCAADATPLQVVVYTPGNVPPRDTWVEVTSSFRSGAHDRVPASVDARQVETISAPEEPHE